MNKVQFGLSNVHISPLINGVYQTPTAIKGAVSLSLEPVHNNYTVTMANGVQQTVSDCVTGYSGSLVFTLLPEVFKTNILGYIKDDNGVLSEKANVNSNRFALLFEVSGDEIERRILFYNCKVVKRNKLESETNGEKKTVKTDSFDIEINPRTKKDMTLKSTILKSENETVFDDWFNKIYEI